MGLDEIGREPNAIYAPAPRKGFCEGMQRSVLRRPDVMAAAIYGSWARGTRRPDSDIDVLVVGDAPLRDLRRAVRPIAKAAGRAVAVTVLSPGEFRRLRHQGASCFRSVLEEPTTALVGDLASLADQ